MVTVKTAILDDDLKDLEKISNYLTSYSNEKVSYEFYCFNEVSESFYKDYELYILDIESPTFNGLEVGKKVKEVNPNAVLIMNSKRNDLVFESFKFGIFYFVRKEYFEMDMHFALERINEFFISQKKYYKYQNKQNIIKIPYNTIMYVEKVKHGVEFHINDSRKMIENKALKDVMQEIQDISFIQCHQSYYVNLNYVDCIDGNDFVLQQERIQISRRYFKTVKQQYIQFLNRK